MPEQLPRTAEGRIAVPTFISGRRAFVRASLFGLGTMTLGSFLAACSSGEAGDAVASAVDGGTLTFAIDGTNATMDPAAYTTMGDWLALDTICSTLTTADFSTNEISGGLASGWTYSDDGLTLTLDLREDVTFHDGSAFGPADVIASFQRQLIDDDPSLPTGATRPLRGATARIIDTVEQVGEHAIALHLSRRDDIMHARLSHTSANILQAAQLSAEGAAVGSAPIGTGPFRFSTATAQQSITLEAYADYFGTPSGLDRIVFQQVADASALNAGLQSGQINASSFVSHSSATSLESVRGVTVADTPQRVNVFTMMNVTTPLLADVRVRRAINMALDRAAICENAFAGFASEPVGYMLSPANTAHDPSLADLSSFDADAAKALIDEAGAAGSAIGLIAQNNNWYPRAAQIIEENLTAIGLVPNVELLDPGTFSGRFFDLEGHDLALWERNGYVPDPDEQVGNLLSTSGSYASKGTGVAEAADLAAASASIDALLVQAVQTSDADKRTSIYSEAQRMYAEEIMACAMVCYTQNIVAATGCTDIGDASLASQRAQLGAAALTA